MPEDQTIAVLKAKHAEIEHAIEEECTRPLPDALVVQMLKRQRLRLKDKINRIVKPN